MGRKCWAEAFHFQKGQSEEASLRRRPLNKGLEVAQEWALQPLGRAFEAGEGLHKASRQQCTDVRQL